MQKFPLDLQQKPLEFHYKKNKNFRHHLFREGYQEQKVLNLSINRAVRDGTQFWDIIETDKTHALAHALSHTCTHTRTHIFLTCISLEYEVDEDDLQGKYFTYILLLILTKLHIFSLAYF